MADEPNPDDEDLSDDSDSGEEEEDFTGKW